MECPAFLAALTFCSGRLPVLCSLGISADMGVGSQVDWVGLELKGAR